MATEKEVQFPVSSRSLCFSREEFLREGFNVDQFLSSCRQRVSLEALRADLAVHLKALKSAMVELINKDYGDFVILSSSLVGMDKEIDNLLVPLGQLREEVLAVKSSIDSVGHALDQKLAICSSLQEKKALLERFLVISRKVDRIEQLLQISGSEHSNISGESDGASELLERVTTEFNELQFQVMQAQGSAFVDNLKPRIAAITARLQQGLEQTFTMGLAAKDAVRLSRCLRTYAAIDRTSAIETLFQTAHVRPALSPVITEQAVSNIVGLRSMYTAILDFVSQSCSLLVQITTMPLSSSLPANAHVGGVEPQLSTANTSSNSQQFGSSVRGIDFLVNAVWPEVVSLIEHQAHSLFAVGNPDVFHVNYLASMEFMVKFEHQCRTQASVKRLRAHPSYDLFMTKWSLPVYFQIRFQEIALQLEQALVTPFDFVDIRHDSDVFHVAAIQTLWQCLQRCWDQDVFLPSLAHRFWKLTLQLLSRFSTWLSEVGSQSTDHQKDGPEETAFTTSQLMMLISDSDTLLQKLPSLTSDSVQRCIHTPNLALQLTDGMLEARLSLKQRFPALSALVSSQLAHTCLQQLEQARTVPRLYRHTNRDLPTQASAYVGQVLRPLQLSLEDHSSLHRKHQQQWSCAALQKICERYHSIVSDVLFSVKKTEDSLKRLKQTRRSLAGSSPAASAGGMSDENKIRRQLALDVEQFGKEIDKLGLSALDVRAFQELQSVVDSATSSASV